MLSRYAPRLPPTPHERRVIAVAVAVLVGLFAAEVMASPGPARLAVLAMFASLPPLLVVHELGHALAARLVGWRVHEIVLGFGREVAAFSIGATRVRVKALPVEGYVRPGPRGADRARWKSAWVYFWGPGAELLVLGALWLSFDGRLFERTEEPALLIAQGAAVAIGIGLAFNLVPLPLGRRVNDGLGIVLSVVRPAEAFEAQMVDPFIVEARRRLLAEDPADAERILSNALAAHPGDTRLVAWRAVALAATGAASTGERLLDGLGDPDAYAPHVASEMHAARAWLLWAPASPAALPFARQAARRALALAPASVHCRILLGRIEYARGQHRDAFRVLLSAYRDSSVFEEEGACLAGLALASEAALAATDLPAVHDEGDGEGALYIRRDYPRRFAVALSQLPVPEALKDQVARVLAA